MKTTASSSRNPARPLRIASSLALALSLCAGASLAAEPATGKPAVKRAAKPAAAAKTPVASPEPKAIDPVLSREQLRACMTQQEKVREQNAEAGRLQAELEREKSELLKDAESMKADLAVLDRTSVEAVQAYNLRATEREQRISIFEPRVAAFNAKAEALNAERAAFVRDCENRKFDERDEDALKKKP